MNRAACPVRRLLRAQHTGKSFPDRVRMSSEPEANPPLRLLFTSQAVAMPHRRFPCNYVVDRRSPHTREARWPRQAWPGEPRTGSVAGAQEFADAPPQPEKVSPLRLEMVEAILSLPKRRECEDGLPGTQACGSAVQGCWVPGTTST